jgi:hypothetical protein
VTRRSKIAAQYRFLLGSDASSVIERKNEKSEESGMVSRLFYNPELCVHQRPGKERSKN